MKSNPMLSSKKRKFASILSMFSAILLAAGTGFVLFKVCNFFLQVTRKGDPKYVVSCKLEISERGRTEAIVLKKVYWGDYEIGLGFPVSEMTSTTGKKETSVPNETTPTLETELPTSVVASPVQTSSNCIVRIEVIEDGKIISDLDIDVTKPRRSYSFSRSTSGRAIVWQDIYLPKAWWPSEIKVIATVIEPGPSSDTPGDVIFFVKPSGVL